MTPGLGHAVRPQSRISSPPAGTRRRSSRMAPPSSGMRRATATRPGTQLVRLSFGLCLRKVFVLQHLDQQLMRFSCDPPTLGTRASSRPSSLHRPGRRERRRSRGCRRAWPRRDAPARGSRPPPPPPRRPGAHHQHVGTRVGQAEGDAPVRCRGPSPVATAASASRPSRWRNKAAGTTTAPSPPERRWPARRRRGAAGC